MSPRLAFAPLLMLAAPAMAEPAQASATPPPTAEIQRALNDPAMADRLTNVMQVLSKTFLELPVGQVQAALEGRAPTAAEKRLTVRDLGRREDPNFDRNLQRQIAQSGPMVQRSMKAMADALPAMMKGFEDAGEALERASTSLPDPTYPKR